MRTKAVQLGALMLAASAIAFPQAEVPRNLSSYQTPAVPMSEVEPANVLSGGLELGGIFDDHMMGTNGNVISGFQPSVSPHIELDMLRPRWDLNLRGNFGYTRYPHYAEPNQYSTDVSSDFAFSLSQRLRVRLSEEFSASSDPIHSLETYRAPGPIVAPNQSYLLPGTWHSSLFTNSEATYVLNRASAVGVTGSFSRLHFANSTGDPGTDFTDTHSYSGSAFYMRQVSRRHVLGVQYAYIDMYSGEAGRTRANSVLFTDRIRFGNSELVLFAGPEHSQTTTVVRPIQGPSYVLRRDSWTPSVGANFSWRGRRNAVGVNFVHRISDGGGLMSAVEMTTGSVSFHSRLTRRVDLDLSGSLTDNKNLDLLSQETRLTSAWAMAGVTYHMTDNLSVSSSYTRVEQGGSESLYGYGDHNRVRVALNYHFTRPLGR